MKLFWKIYLAVVIPAIVIGSLFTYVIATFELSHEQEHAIRLNRLASKLLTREIEKEYIESRWPFDSLKKLSEGDDFLFWWIVTDDGTIHLANDTSFIGTHAYTYFPQIEPVPDGAKSILDKKRNCGVFVKFFGKGKPRSFWLGFSLKHLAELQSKIIQMSALLLVLTVGTLGIVVYFTVKHFTRPIGTLAEGATIIGKGNLNHRVKTQSKDELGYLAESFNEMAEHLEQTTTSIDNLNREITERKKAEQQQAELLKKVEAANQELKDFAHIVSHDLKAPLRGISTLASWMSTDYADKFDKDGREQIELLLSRVDRMHNLIDGILRYSRVGRTKEEMSQVNLNELVPDIIDMIASSESITVTVENELPVIECEKTRIAQVFQNLLSNAVKYMEKSQGQIRVGCVEENGFWKFSVADNGPGIEERHFEKIFQIFQTLSPRDEVESTGVGLTLVKKIVEMYGGKIWVESKMGEGSTFFFTLPKQKVGGKNAKPQASIVSRR